MSTIFGPNPARYRKLSEPYATVEKCEESVRAFSEAVGEAREKFGVRDVLVVVAGTYLNPNQPDVESGYLTTFSFGNVHTAAQLAAFAYGHEMERFQENMDVLIAGPRTRLRKRED